METGECGERILIISHHSIRPYFKPPLFHFLPVIFGLDPEISTLNHFSFQVDISGSSRLRRPLGVPRGPKMTLIVVEWERG